jgi:hypothetical protein
MASMLRGGDKHPHSLYFIDLGGKLFPLRRNSLELVFDTGALSELGLRPALLCMVAAFPHSVTRPCSVARSTHVQTIAHRRARDLD